MTAAAPAPKALPATAPAVPKEGTRDRIMRIADDLFAHHGYARVSMRSVAQAAGVTKPALYYHFRDKQALYEECIAIDQDRQENAVLRAGQSEGTFAERLTAVARAVLSASPHHPVRVIYDLAEHLPEDAATRIQRTYSDAVTGPVVQFFTTAASRGELRPGLTPAAAGTALLGMCMASALPVVEMHGQGAGALLPASQNGASAGAARAVEAVVDILLRGVAA